MDPAKRPSEVRLPIVKLIPFVVGAAAGGGCCWGVPGMAAGGAGGCGLKASATGAGAG